MQETAIAETSPTRFGISPELIESIRAAIEAGDREKVAELVAPLHEADIADIIEQISPAERRALITLHPEIVEGEVLPELDEDLREEIIGYLPRKVLVETMRELETDDVIDIVEDLEEEQKDEILEVLEDSDRVAVEQALEYPEGTAARLMQREMVTMPAHWTVGRAIDHLRAAEELPEEFYHVILVDPRHHPVGIVPLGRLLASKRDVKLADITDDNFHPIPAEMPQEDVAYLYNQYHLITTPVVDGAGRLIGVITIDDAMEVLDEEAAEDMLRLAGVGDESISDTISDIVRDRFTWLFVNLVTAILASIVISWFSDTIDAYVALAVLMPIVASMGGNAGTQSMTVAVRGIATKDITPSNAWRVIRREVMVGLLNGLAFALVMGLVSWWWFDEPMLGVVIAIAMVLTLVAAAVGGIVIPLVLARFGIDPAVASGPFVTTVTDIVSFFTFLSIASALLLGGDAAGSPGG